MATDIHSDQWIPLVEFSVQKGISLSTLRRYIKQNKIPWKLLDGRYLVMDDGTFIAPRNHAAQAGLVSSPAAHSTNNSTEARLQHLEESLTAANEEIAELKTLLAFYEEKWMQQVSKKTSKGS